MEDAVQERDAPLMHASVKEQYSLHNRLSLPFSVRTIIAVTGAGMTGFSLGASHGGSMAALRYRAENAHRLPTYQTDWFLYHKSKNYNVMFGGIKEGFRMGGRLTALVGGFMVMEEAVDCLRGESDFLSTVTASLGTAGIYSLWHQFSLHTAARTAKMGLVVGLGYGLAQDAIGYVQGRKLRYLNVFLT